MISWLAFEYKTFSIKMRYANFSESLHNSTLFVSNSTQVLWSCTSAIEQVYNFSLAEVAQFNGFVDWSLAVLQSVLGNALRITDMITNLKTISDQRMPFYYCGLIIKMFFIVDPIS